MKSKEEHDQLMKECEKKVDLAMLSVINASRQVVVCRLSPSLSEYVDELDKAIKEFDKVKIEWLDLARENWAQA